MNRMGTSNLVLAIALSGIFSCGDAGTGNTFAITPDAEMNPASADTIQQVELTHSEGMTVATRFGVPAGYQRTVVVQESFAAYLRNLPLKSHGSPVLLYDGRQKHPSDVHAAVIDLDVGSRDLQQCADAVIRLRAEYLYGRRDYPSIHFNFTSGDTAFFTKWIEGMRPVVQGRSVRWQKLALRDDSYSSFRKYLDVVFNYSGTYSLEKELVRISPDKISAGDVFIQGGFPGHTVIVVDMAFHPGTGKKIFLLAQSYMPAQEIHILRNPGDPALSPWFCNDFPDYLRTPEWDFNREHLRRFRD